MSKYEFNKSVVYHDVIWIRTEGASYTSIDFDADIAFVTSKFHLNLRQRTLWVHPFHGGIIIMTRNPGIIQLDGNFNATLWESRAGKTTKVAKGALYEMFDDFLVEFDSSKLRTFEHIDDLAKYCSGHQFMVT